MSTPRMTKSERLARLADALIDGPGTQADLLTRSGLTPHQFRQGWHDLQNSEVPDELRRVAIYDPATNLYGLWPVGAEAWNGTVNRVNDALTRVVTIDTAAFQTLAAARVITPRMYRAVMMLRDEFEELSVGLVETFEAWQEAAIASGLDEHDA